MSNINEGIAPQKPIPLKLVKSPEPSFKAGRVPQILLRGVSFCAPLQAPPTKMLFQPPYEKYRVPLISLGQHLTN